LLLSNRKFDIRVWLLLTSDLSVHLFREGYLRTASCEYRCGNPTDPYVHLTNNAVQRFAPTYGGFEDGNQLSFAEFDRQYA
jgi:hypothetical protein